MHSAPYTSAIWRNPELLREIYVPEIQDMLKRIRGAESVVTETILLREFSESQQDNVTADADRGQNDPTKEAQPALSPASRCPQPATSTTVDRGLST